MIAIAQDTETGPLCLVTTSHPSVFEHTTKQHQAANGEWVHPNLGRLLQPRHYSSVARTAQAGIPWACDNDFFGGYTEERITRYEKMLNKIEGLPGCLWVTCPDIVGDAAATLELAKKWIPILRGKGLPVALVAQDGLEDMLDEIPWGQINCLFIGGSTEWKESQAARDIADLARSKGRLVHWGRVSSKRRFDLCVAEHGDSFDSSGLAIHRKAVKPGAPRGSERFVEYGKLNPALRWCVEAAANLTAKRAQPAVA